MAAEREALAEALAWLDAHADPSVRAQVGTRYGRQFGEALVLIESGAVDERPLVQKAVIMAARAIGRKRPSLLSELRAVAERLASSSDAAPRRVGRAVLRD